MIIPLSDEPPTRSGFITWKRLAELFKLSGDVKPGESVSLLDVGRNGINYAVAAPPLERSPQ